MYIASNKTVLTKRDILNFQNLSILKSSWIVAIFAVAFVLLAFRVRDGQFVFESVFFVVIGAALLPVYFIVVKAILAKQNKHIPPQTTYVYNFFDSHIEVFASDGTHTEQLASNYNEMKGFKAQKKYIQIVVDKSVTLFIKKSGFEEKEDVAKVENLLALKIINDKKKKG